jgi:hypothetical protein
MGEKFKSNCYDAYNKTNVSLVPPDKCMDRKKFIEWYFSTTPINRRQQKYIRIRK